MKWYAYLICVALIVAGIFSCFELDKMFNVSSKDVGSPIVVQQSTEELGKYDLSDLIFEPDQINEANGFVYQKSYSPIEYDARVNRYQLLLNGKKLPNITYSPGSITGEIVTNYYNTENEIIASTKLNLTIQFNKSQTLIKLQCANNAYSNISYLQKYIDINGFVLQIKKEV